MADMYTSPIHYPYCIPSTLYWKFRQWNWKKEIQTYQPHILCLQEVETEVLDLFLDDFMISQNGYSRIVKINHIPEGCAIYWKTDRFKLIMDESQTFQVLAMDKWKQETSKDKTLYSTLLNQIMSLKHHNVIAVAILEEIETGHRLIITTTHLYWGSGLSWEHFYQLQVIQLNLLSDYLYHIEQKYGGNLPIILTGDFNTKGDHLTQFFQNQYLPVDHPLITRNGKEDSVASHPLENKLHLFGLTDVFSIRKPGGLEYTNITGEYTGTLDYILYSGGLVIPKAVFEPYTKDIYLQQTGLPSIYFPSDHISLFADFSFK